MGIVEGSVGFLFQFLLSSFWDPLVYSLYILWASPLWDLLISPCFFFMNISLTLLIKKKKKTISITLN